MKIKLISKTALALIILTMMNISCSKTEDDLPSSPVPISLTSEQTALVESGNSFAFDIFKNIINDEPESKNVMISPLSISYALSMTVNGADGETREAILDALRVSGIGVEALNNSYSKLTDDLLSVDKRVLMTIANSVWTEDDFDVSKAFRDVLVKYYNAEAGEFDINDPSAPDKMNAWIESKTNGLIKDMVTELDDNVVMLLINAIYFKGKWSSEFDESETVNLPFYKQASGSVEVPMMKQKSKFNVFEGNSLLVAEFPYGQGNFVMDVILPTGSATLSSVMDQMTGSGFNGWLSQLSQRETDVTFPRFKYGYKKQLKEILGSMGMQIAFTDNADFSNISEQYDLLINQVTHQSFIETNEEGTEAAAATTVEFGTTSVPSYLEFNMDHPFIYVIREITTNSIIFMGRVADPSVN